jgi:hypothetical protein
MEADFNDKKPIKQDQIAFAQVCAYAISRLIRIESYEIPDSGDPEAMASQFLLESEVKEEKFPMNPILIYKEQEKDKKLGSEFKQVFDEMRNNYGMKKQVTTAYNPQANGIR